MRKMDINTICFLKITNLKLFKKKLLNYNYTRYSTREEWIMLHVVKRDGRELDIDVTPKKEESVVEEKTVEKTEEISDNVSEPSVEDAPKKGRRPNRGKGRVKKTTKTTKKKTEDEE